MSIDVESHGGIQVKIGSLLTSQGKSAYEIAVSSGFAGTEAEWLMSLDGVSTYEIAVSNGFAGTEAEWLASLEGDNLTDAEVKTKYENNTNTNSYTDDEKSKLAGLESSKFLGAYISLAALQLAYPSPLEGSYGDVDTGVGNDVARYVWDNSDSQYVEQGAGTTLTAAQIKAEYESNPDTNAFSDAEKAKLVTINENAEENAPLYATVVTKTADYTVLAGDLGKLIRVNSAGAVVLTFPDGLLKGFWCSVQLVGDGTVEISATATESGEGHTFLRVKYAGCSVVHIDDNGTCSIIGQLAA
jgi:hypothetical protein